MAMNTWLQMVSEDEIAVLKRDPASINKLNKPENESCSTYYACSINYFLVGDAYPSGEQDNPLTGFLGGFESVECNTLENGCFHIVPAAMADPIAVALGKLDLDAIKAKVNEADPGELADEEVDDFEILTDDDADPGDTLASDVAALREFYRSAAKAKRGVVIYTS
jgi:hypothetical protein